MRGIRFFYQSRGSAASLLLSRRDSTLESPSRIKYKRGWTGRPFKQGPVSIRCRRVHSPLVREGDPRRAGKPEPGVELSCVAFREGSSRSADPGSCWSDPRVGRGPIGADAQHVGGSPLAAHVPAGYREPHNLSLRLRKVNKPERFRPESRAWEASAWVLRLWSSIPWPSRSPESPPFFRT